MCSITFFHIITKFNLDYIFIKLFMSTTVIYFQSNLFTIIIILYISNHTLKIIMFKAQKKKNQIFNQQFKTMSGEGSTSHYSLS